MTKIRNDKCIDRIVYYWAVLFLLPIVSSYILNAQDVIRNFNYLWAFIFVIYLIKNKFSLLKHEGNISKKAIIIFFSVCFISIAYSQISKLYAFRVNAYDFGIFQSMLEEALKGNWGYSNVVNYYHLATHQNYILVTILPIYAIFRSPIFLQLCTTILIITPSLVLWFLMYKNTNQLFAFIIAVSYLLSPFNGITNDFKPELFGPALFTLSYFFYSRRQFKYFMLFSLLFLMTSEECTLYLFGFSIYLLYKKDYKYFSIAIIYSISVVLINNMVVQPYFVHKSGMLHPTTLAFFSNWGVTKGEIARNMLSSPIKVIACVFDLNSGFWRLYTPFLFLPLLDPFLLCTGFLATILYATSNSDTMVHYNQYHGLLLNAILFISLARICQSIHNNNTKLDIYKRIFLTSSKYLQIKKIILLLLIICFPLWGVGFQEFYPIKIKEIRNFEQVKQVLYTNYSHNNICPQENLLPMFLSEPLNITHDGSIFNLKKPCVIVFTTLGDSWPYTKSQIKQEIRKRKNSCGVLGDFYICPNSGI